MKDADKNTNAKNRKWTPTSKIRRVIALGLSLGVTLGLVAVPTPMASAAPDLIPVAARAGIARDWRVPVVDSQAGVGTALSTTSDAVVPLPSLPAGHDSALIRVSVLGADQETRVYAAGTLALVVASGTSASTTVLVPVIEGAVALSANHSAAARVELLASFKGDPATPGSTIALPVPYSRAGTEGTALAGDSVGTGGVSVGLVGLGGVPSVGVRAAYVTVIVTASEVGDLVIDGQVMAIDAGTVALTTAVTPDSDGTTTVAYSPNTGSSGTATLRVDIRGWVSEAPQDSERANVSGGYVPVPSGEPVAASVSLHETTTVEAPVTADSVLALVLLAADPSETIALVDLGQPRPGRGSGAVVDPSVGALPQLTVVDLVDTQAEVLSHNSAVTVQASWLGGFLGDDAPEGADPVVAITSPNDGAVVDLAAERGFHMSGTVASANAVDRVFIEADGEVVGAARLVYGPDRVEWFYDGAGADGSHELQAVAYDRAGKASTSRVHLELIAPFSSEIVIAPDTVVLPSATSTGTPLVASVSDDQIVVNEEPGFSPGDVIVSDVTPNAPQGFLRRVEAIDRAGDTWIMTTSVAALTDAIWWCDEDDTVDLVAVGDSLIGNAEPEPGVEVVDEGARDFAILSGEESDTSELPNVAVEADGDEPRGATTAPQPVPMLSRAYGIDRTLTETYKVGVDLRLPMGPGKIIDLSKANQSSRNKSKNEIKLEGGVALSASAQIGLSLKTVVKISIEWNWGWPTAIVDDFTVKLTQTTKIQHSVDVSFKGKWEKSFSKTLATIRPATITFSIGPVPVVVTSTVKFTFDAKILASAAITASTGESVQRKQEYGFSYSTKNGLKNLRTDKTTYDDPWEPKEILEDEFKADLEASVGINASLSISIYDAFGPVFSVGVTAKVDGRFTSTIDSVAGEWKASARLGLDLGAKLSGKVEFKVPIIDKVLLSSTLLSLNINLPLWEGCWKNGTGFGACDTEEPKGSPSTSAPTATPSAAPSTGASVNDLCGGAVRPSSATKDSSSRPVKFIQVASDMNGNASLALSDTGEVYSWGTNQVVAYWGGLLGRGPREDLICGTPGVIPYLADIASIGIAGASRPVAWAVTHDGRLFIWGQGLSTLARSVLSWYWNDKASRYIPFEVMGLPPVKKAASDDDQLLALAEDGTVWAISTPPASLGLAGTWLIDALAPSGVVMSDGGGLYISEPTQVPGLLDIVDFDASTTRWAFATSRGDVYVMGGTGWEYSTISSPTLVAGVKDAVQVSAGGPWSYFCVLTARGEGYALGVGGDSPISEGHSPTRIGENLVQVTCGYDKVLSVTDSGAVLYSGYSGSFYDEAVFESGPSVDNPRPVAGLGSVAYATKITSSGGLGHGQSGLAVTSEGELYGWGEQWGLDSQGNIERQFWYPAQQIHINA